MSNKKVSFFWICIFVQIDLTFFIHFKHVWMLYPKKKTKVSVPNDLNFKYVRRFWKIWIFSRNIIIFCFIYSLFFIFWLFVTIIIIFYLNGCWTWKGFGFVLEKKKKHIFNCLSNERYVSEQLLLLREYIRKWLTLCTGSL